MGKPLEDIEKRLTNIEGMVRQIIASTVNKEVLTIDEAVLLTGFNKGYLYKLTSEKKIPHYKCGRELRFDRAELIAWMKSDRVKTQEEIDSAADTFIATNRKNKRK